MSLSVRRIVFACLGVVAGLLAWPFSELLVASQGAFVSLLLFTVVSGSVVGLLFGAVFGSANGIFLARLRRVGTGAGWGAVIGVVGGALGFLIGQGVLLVVGEQMASPGTRAYELSLPVARAVGWMVLGAFVGASDGIRARSGLRVRAGALGGLLGGLVGGLVLEYGRFLLPGEPYVRLAAFVFLGLAIAGFFALVEKRLSFGLLRLLSGPFKGKEFIVNQRRLTFGSADSCDVVLGDYQGVKPLHFSLLERNGNLHFFVHRGSVRWNDEPMTAESGVSERPLKFEDVLAAGSAKFLYLPE